MSSTDASVAADLRVICGPTGAGKSALARAIAERASVAIVSADSRQVFRGFDIGTAKPSPLERADVPHFGIDVADPTERYTAAHWASQVPGWLSGIERTGRSPLIVGGTGFYLRALLTPLFEEPPIEEERRQVLRTWLDRLATPEVRRWCDALDPGRVHLGRAQWERAVEVALLAGRRISELHSERSRAALLTARYLVVDPGTSLAATLQSRVDAMLASGWMEEVRGLVDRVPASARAWSATGYDALRRVVVEGRSLDEARHEVVVRTRQYAKRQRTWFRHQLGGQRVTRIDPKTPDAIAQAMEWFHGAGEDS